MSDDTLQEIEIDLLLEGVYRHYGHDFRDYSPPSVKRRILQVVSNEGTHTITGLQEKILHDTACLHRFLDAFSIDVTSMFRDPDFYLALRKRVVPLLRTYPFVRIWNAGCATGQEAYSLAILLTEEGIYDRCHIYATDFNKSALHKAQAGIFPQSKLGEYSANYLEAGGTSPFSDYYQIKEPGMAVLDPLLKRNIIFAQHNLAIDGILNEFNVILCRNVLIYFNKVLQDRVHKLLYDSLAIFGVLGLGKKETIRFTSHQGCYQELDGPVRLYRKVK